MREEKKRVSRSSARSNEKATRLEKSDFVNLAKCSTQNPKQDARRGRKREKEKSPTKLNKSIEQGLSLSRS